MNQLSPLLPILLLFSCSNQQDRNLSAFAQVPVYELEEEFRVAGFGEGEFFGHISGISVGVDQAIFVSDPDTRKIHVFEDDGSYTGFLGGYGEGPGEFRRISNMSLLTPDTLQVIDITQARITLYSISDRQWDVVKIFDLPMSPHIDTDFDFFSFLQFYRFDEGHIAVFESTISTFVNSDHFIKVCFSFYDVDFQPNDAHNPICHNRFELIVHESFSSSVHTVSARPVPEGYQTLFAVTPEGNIVSTWTEHPELSIQRITDSESTGFEYISEQIPITSEQKIALAEQAIPNERASSIRRDQVINAVPPYKAYAEQMLIDDKDQIWILTRSADDNLEWLIYNYNGNLMGRSFHPGGTFMQIKDDKIYIAHNSNDVEPAFAVFRIMIYD